MELPDPDRAHFTKIAKHMTSALLDATSMAKALPWKVVYEKKNFAIHRTELCGIAPVNVHAATKLAAEIEDVTENLITTTTESYKAMMGMLSSDFLDGAVLANIVLPSPARPFQYVGLKWAAFKSATPFVKDKDFVLLEYVDLIEDAQGRKTSFRVMQSVEIPTYLETPGKFARESVPLVGFIYYTTKKAGELRMTYSCSIDKNGDLPTWAANAAIQSHVEKCISKTLKYIEYQRMRRDAFVLPQQVIPLAEDQGNCQVCTKPFMSLYRHKYTCLKCGNVVCSKCSALRNAEVPELGMRKLRVCTACVIQVRLTHRRGSADLKTSLTSSSDGTSSSCCSVPDVPGRQMIEDILQPVRLHVRDEYRVFSALHDALPTAFPVRAASDSRVPSFRAGRRVTVGAPEIAATIAQLRETNDDMRRMLPLSPPRNVVPLDRYHRRRTTVGATELASVLSEFHASRDDNAAIARIIAADSEVLSSDSEDSEDDDDDDVSATTDDESTDERKQLTETTLREFDSIQSCIARSRQIVEVTEQAHKIASIVRQQTQVLASLSSANGSRKSSFSSTTTISQPRKPSAGAILFDSSEYESRLDDDTLRLRQFQASQAAQRRRSSNDVAKPAARRYFLF
ncbi:hypothetical protein SDRG_06249 [Saprolegnia diclina VS20]|uniref:FYVE-type domain-containing protein n=1 Tax=Saprolegnia diclina (strain VS20) TaxID=1156394 RepID=T0RUJ8_SAPDV|nr:hypothetical protein SDRG_06249 [Saprolegnia diclina VS20]EQC36133.1 hypothetical protein SDRG_06249 [Saprolegnia diclina VS20]|eukprot:XP_008610239.1 hypothetical protein SDRG_06249 [Saprolegnia diclina VS20]